MNNYTFWYNNFLLSLLLLVIFTPVRAENSLVINISKDTYQAESKNWDIDQDEKGILYIANNEGLLQFDGVSWILNHLPQSTIVRSVLVASHDSIFTGSFEDFGVWNRDNSGKLVYQSLLPEEYKAVQQNDDFWKIYKVGHEVYFQSFTSIFSYDGNNINKLDSNGGLMFLSKVANELYVQTIGGTLNRVYNDKLIPIPNSELFNKAEVRFVLPYKESGLLIGTSNMGFYAYVDNEFYPLHGGFNIIAKENPNVGIYAANGDYFIGTLSDGLFQINEQGKIVEHINADYNLQTNTVLSIFQDSLGDIWLGLDGGITLIRDVDNLDLFVNRYNDIGGVYDAVEWNNFLLLATNHRVFSLPLADLDLPAQNRRWKMVDGTEGQVWGFRLIDNQLFVLHNRGVLRLNSNLKTEVFNSPDVGIYDMIKTKLGENNYFIYGSYFRLYKSLPNGDELTFFEDLKQPIKHVEVDHLNNLWLEHPEKGIYRCRFNNTYDAFKSIEYYGGKDGLPFKLSFFKVGGRMEIYGAGKFYSYHELSNQIVENELLNNALTAYQIKKVVPIKDYYYWAIGSKSIVKFMYDGYQIKILSTLQTGPFCSMISGYENIAMLTDSTQVICFDNGFGVLNDRNYQTPIEGGISLPKPEVRYLAIKDIDTDHVKYIHGPFIEKQNINFAYNSIGCKVLIKNQFNLNYSLSYKLHNVNSSWVKLPKSNSISFDRLPVGKYMLELKTTDELGNESAVSKVEFVIKPPWYASKLSILLYLFLILSAMYLTWRLLLRRYRNLHLRKIRQREIARLRSKAENLEVEVESKNAEMFTMTSFIVYKNELINRLKDLVHNYYQKNKIKSLLPLIQQIDSLISQSVNPEDDWRLFLIKFEEKNANFFTHLKACYPELTSTDLRLCACLKLNMDTKEIASLMNATVRSVENRRYRLRKKMGLTPEQNLNEFLIQIN